MKYSMLVLFTIAAGAATVATAQSHGSCADLAGLKLEGVAITTAEPIPAGTTVPPLYPGAPGIGPLPAHCRVDGVINRRKGVDGQEFGMRISTPDEILPDPGKPSKGRSALAYNPMWRKL